MILQLAEKLKATLNELADTQVKVEGVIQPILKPSLPKSEDPKPVKGGAVIDSDLENALQELLEIAQTLIDGNENLISRVAL